MIGLILAAGYGTRLRPLTYFKPKPMIKVGGIPVLERIAHHMRMHGVEKIIINTHYKPLSIMKHFNDEFLYTYETELLGETGTIKSIEKYVDDALVVMNGDTITNIDITAMKRISKGRNIAAYDGDVYTGCKILYPNQRINKYSIYRDAHLKWIDIGTKKGLWEARKKYG